MKSSSQKHRKAVLGSFLSAIRSIKSQVSMEYLIIVGFAMAAMVPLIILYITYSQDSVDEVTFSQIDKISREVVDAAEAVYYLGYPSQTTVQVYMPTHVNAVSLENYEIVFTLDRREGTTSIVRPSFVNITGALPKEKGLYTIVIRAFSGYVNVSYK
jgi:hypothetical protein